MVKRLVEDMEDYGYGNTKVIVKSDQEPAMKYVISGIARQRQAETIPEHSPVGDSKSNGMAENCCKQACKEYSEHSRARWKAILAQ